MGSIEPVVASTTSITDWLMVIITAVYVIATIAICVANFKSAKATRDQISESKRQYDEENRPNIEVELIYERRLWYIVRLVNNGKRTAQHVNIQIPQEFIDSLPEESFRAMLEKQKSKECIIGVGQHYDLFIGSNKLRGNPNMLPFTGKLSYQSEANTYTSDLYIDLENYMTFFSSTSHHEELVKELKECTHQLREISKSISALHIEEAENDDNA